MIYSISNIAWNPANKNQAYSILQKNNFKGLEVAPGLLFHEIENPISPKKKDIVKVKNELKSYELRLVSMQSLLFGKNNALLFGNSDERKLFFDEVLNVIKLAEILEIPNLVFGSPSNRIIPDGMSQTESNEIAFSTFYKLGQNAHSSGTSISIEPNPKEYGTNFINTMSEAANFVENINCLGITSILDVGALKMNNELKNLESILDSIAGRLNHVHVSEPYLAPAPKNCKELDNLYNLLTNIGYKKAISIEMKNKNYPIEYMEKYLKKISDRK